jgi:hypothetical protein
VHQRHRPEPLPRPLLRQLLRRQLAQLVVDQRQELLRPPGFAPLGGPEDLGRLLDRYARSGGLR